MSTQQELNDHMQTVRHLDDLNGSPGARTAVEPSLNKSVQGAVDAYIETMDDQKVTDLYELVLCEVEMPLLSCVLRHTGQNQSQTAQILGLNRGTLRKKMKKYGML